MLILSGIFTSNLTVLKSLKVYEYNIMLRNTALTQNIIGKNFYLESYREFSL